MKINRSNTYDNVGSSPPSPISRRIQYLVLGFNSLLSLCLVASGGLCFSGEKSVCPPALDQLIPDTNTTGTNHSSKGHPHHDTTAGLPVLLLGLVLVTPSVFVSCCIGKESSHRDALRFLYGSHFMSAWGDRMWQMAVPIFLIDIFKSTLLPTGLYAAFVYLLNVVFLPRLGVWVDETSRILVQRVGLAIENLAVALTSVVICCMVIFLPDLGLKKQSLSDSHILSAYVALLLLGGVGELFNGVQTISIEKDWVVVLSKESNIDLGLLNTTMRRIDLSCKALAPFAFTMMYQYVGNDVRTRIFYGALMIGFWNVISFPVEWILNTRVYEAFPRLRMKFHTHTDGTSHVHENGHKPHTHYFHMHEDGTEHEHNGPVYHSHEGYGAVINLKNQKQTRVVPSLNSNPQGGAGTSTGCCSRWVVYGNHPIFFASLSYTLLWMTVLDNGALMTSYLQWRGVPHVLWF